MMVIEGEAAPGKENPETKSGPAKYVLPVLVPVVIAILVSAFTPVGEGLRNALFPSSKTVRGSVKLKGEPLAGAKLTVDGGRETTTDATGAFAVTNVKQGDHVLVIEALNAQRRVVPFPVTRRSEAVDLGALDVAPSLRIGVEVAQALEPVLGTLTFKYNYDVTMWLDGDAGSLGRVAKVTYSFPTGFQVKPAVVSSPTNQFCHHRSGSVSDATKVAGQLTAAVLFKDGRSLALTVPSAELKADGTKPGGCT